MGAHQIVRAGLGGDVVKGPLIGATTRSRTSFTIPCLTGLSRFWHLELAEALPRF